MMAGFRRGYVYFICAVSLIVAAVGLANVLEIGIVYALDLPTGPTWREEPGSEIRQRLSMYLAAMAVSIPLLALHWYLAERWSRPESGESDRNSGIRALYFAAVLSVSLLIATIALGTIIDNGVARLFGVELFVSARDGVVTGVTFIVTGAIWASHIWLRTRDERLIAMARPGIRPVRAYLYVALVVGAILFASGVGEILSQIVDDMTRSIGSLSWFDESLAGPLSRIIVGGLIWGLHWAYSLRLLHAAGWTARVERASVLRRVALYVLFLIGVGTTLVAWSFALGELLEAAITGSSVDLSAVLQPLAFTPPFLVLWFFHRYRMLLEWRDFSGDEGLASAIRLHRYTIAFVGLVMWAIGLGYLAGVTIEFMFSSMGLSDAGPVWEDQNAGYFGALVIIGGAFWLTHWIVQQRTVAQSPDIEQGAQSRRAYLYLVLTFSILALLAGLATLLYQLLQVAMGVSDTTGLASSTASLLGVILIASITVGAHIRWLLRDTRDSAAVSGHEPTDTISPAGMSELSLVLSGPDEKTVRRALADVRSTLPSGVELTEIEPGNLPPSDEMGSPGAVEQHQDETLPETEAGDPETERSDESPDGRIFR